MLFCVTLSTGTHAALVAASLLVFEHVHDEGEASLEGRAAPRALVLSVAVRRRRLLLLMLLQHDPGRLWLRPRWSCFVRSNLCWRLAFRRAGLGLRPPFGLRLRLRLSFALSLRRLLWRSSPFTRPKRRLNTSREDVSQCGETNEES